VLWPLGSGDTLASRCRARSRRAPGLCWGRAWTVFAYLFGTLGQFESNLRFDPSRWSRQTSVSSAALVEKSLGSARLFPPAFVVLTFPRPPFGRAVVEKELRTLSRTPQGSGWYSSWASRFGLVVVASVDPRPGPTGIRPRLKNFLTLVCL